MTKRKYFNRGKNISLTIGILTFVGFIFTGFYLNDIAASSESQKLFLAENLDSLPYVLAKNHSDMIDSKLRFDAALDFSKYQLPNNLKDWETYSVQLKNEIIEKTGLIIDHNLPLNAVETGTISMNGYSIKNIYFQTRPGVFATANLYIPDGDGKFPGVIVMMGHSRIGKLYDEYQSIGHTLALNNYVALCIDPWGSGERTTIHGEFEDHGDRNNLGSSLLNIGETFIGLQISDNIRGVDYLCSLSNVDSLKIGATGASGGGNQTMWLAAIDKRIKAVVPVVSVGTFESYIMGSPCICEVLQDGLTFTEQAGILALIAPRALKMCNHAQDSNPAFFSSEMIRSYKNAKPIFELFEAADNISYEIYDLPHGYDREDREAMLGWFDLHLKGIGDGSQKKEKPFQLQPKEKLMVFEKGKRDSNVTSTEIFCVLQGAKLREKLLDSKTIDVKAKRSELGKILGVDGMPTLKEIYEFPDENGWERYALETSDNKLIPILLKAAPGNSKSYIILCNSKGKNSVPSDLILEVIDSGKGLVLVDLSGSGEVNSSNSVEDKNGNMQIYSRSLLWFGKTLIGEWTKELTSTIEFLQMKFDAKKIDVDGNMEAGLAALFLSALEGNIENIVLRNCPVSYLFDNRESIDYFSMGINIPGFLNWGDISLAAALSGKEITLINPVTMSGRELNENNLAEYRKEFDDLRKICKQPGKTIFSKSPVAK